jgi:hypothetical protein
MFRLKVIFGGKLRSRKFDNQTVELFLQCAALQTLDHCLGRCLLGPLKFCSENS